MSIDHSSHGNPGLVAAAAAQKAARSWDPAARPRALHRAPQKMLGDLEGEKNRGNHWAYGFYMVSMRFLPMITVYSIYSIRFYKIFRVFGENLTRFYSYLCGSTDVRFLQTWTQRTRNGRAWHQKIGFDQPSTCGHVSTQAEGHGRFLWLIWMIFLVVSLVVRQPNMTHFTSGQSSDGVPSGNLT